MSYIGNPPAEAYTNTVKDTFSGDGSTVAFTLSLPTTTNNVRVVVENVIQDPTVAYGVSGTTLTFTSAPPSGTNNIYVVHLGPAVQTVVPPDSVTITDLNAYADGAAAFTANRATSNGTIIDLQKDGSSVGEIGYGGNLGVTGVWFGNDTNNRLYFSNDDSTIIPGADDNTSLGSSVARFKNIRLSGGVYLGGTGSANYLDDYEEGTWTPTNNGAAVTFTVIDAKYTKVGRLVTVNLFISTISTVLTTQTTIGGLPFPVVADSYFLAPLNHNSGSASTCFARAQPATSTLIGLNPDNAPKDWNLFNGSFLLTSVSYFTT
jgi:hypothetical protein